MIPPGVQGDAPEPERRFDAVIIGTGQAGKPLAGALADAGQRVAIVEKADRVGGSCVVEGCTPTKTMVASARVAYLARRAADFGVHTGDVRVEMSEVRARKRDMVEQWSSGARKGLEKKDGVELIHGRARFVGRRRIAVDREEGKPLVLGAERVFINAGTRNRIPQVEGLDRVSWYDNATLMEVDRVPDHLLILGGGFVGVEFAQMFRRFGARVTVLEAGDRFLPREDEDVSEELASILREDGIDLRLSARARSVREVDGGVELTLEGDGERVRGSHLMISVGRVPDVEGMELEAGGVELDDRGFIRVDDRLRTSADAVWALGDVNGGPPFTHVSYDDHRIVKENLLGEGGASRADRILPYTLFTDPELGRVGLTEAAAREAGHPVRVAKLPMTRVARAMESDQTRGFMKAVVHAETDRILGAAILGMYGGEVAAVIQAAMLGDLPFTALRDGVFAHPTLAESLNNLFMTLD